MRICGLDVATKTGWCIATGNTYQTGLFDAGKVGKRKVTCEAERNAEFRKWLWTLLKTNDVQFVGIERRAVSNMRKKVRDPATGKMIEKVITNDATAATLAYLNGTAQEVCFSLNIPFELVAVQTWRKTFLGGMKPGNGEDWKDVAKRVCQMMKIEAKSKDAAEAAGLAFHVQTQMKLQRAQAPAGGLFDQEDAA
ncbi:hypothetical protein [Roseibium sp.]|uniref:hypothetical protein n=1 Tax=Roseibium sp. TaxID=1936156 RepID=UPI001B005D9D|nr:hypothetical protein [Roseibium sp.]MBO6858345.1 hypothetical protein [Roseibium sp.]